MNERVRIDETDTKILHQLLRESRTSFTDLAKICNITVGAVRMRYKKLWRIGVINGEIMLVNPQSLGYNCISDIGILTSLEDEKKAIEFLKSRPYIQHVMGLYGKYNITVKVAFTDMQELAAILEDLESNPFTKQVDAMIWAEVVNIDHPENLLINSSTENQPQPILHNYSSTKNPIVLDEIDRKIAKILSQRSRATFRKIAEQTGISTKNVIQRYRKLRGTVLMQSTITVDLKKLGYNASASVFVKAANKSKLPEVHAQILKMPNLLVALRLIGPYDMLIVVALRDFQELFYLKNKIRGMQGIEETETHLNPSGQAYPLNLFKSLL